jgi:hypothetical protein
MHTAPCAPAGDTLSSSATSAKEAAAGAGNGLRERLDSALASLKGWMAWGDSVSKETQEQTTGAFDELRCAWWGCRHTWCC